MEKLNCWDVKKCGRELGGSKSREFGVCPAAVCTKLNGSNSGKNGGRSCWVVAGTFCRNELQMTFDQKIKNCLECDFYKKVQSEKDDNSVRDSELINRLFD